MPDLVLHVAPFNAQQFVKEFEQAFQSKDLGRVEKLYDANVEFLDPEGKTVRGFDQFRAFMDMWAEGFSDTKIELIQTLQQGNEVALYQRCTARHTGEFEIMPGERIPPTNKQIRIDVAEFIRLDANGKIVRDVSVMDTAVVMKQLGVLPSATTKEQRRAVER